MKKLTEIDIFNKLKVGEIVQYKGHKKIIDAISWNKELGYSITFKGENKPNYEIDKMEIKE